MFIGGVPGDVLPMLTLTDPSAKWAREAPRLMLFGPKTLAVQGTFLIIPKKSMKKTSVIDGKLISG